MKTTSILATLLSLLLLTSCDKVDNPVITPPPPPPPKTDCLVSLLSSQDVVNNWHYTTFYYNAARRVDSTKNNLHFTRHYYSDTQLVRREFMFTNGRQLLRYDSLFYYPDGKLKQVKIFDDWPNPGVFVIENVLSFTYSGNRISKLVKSDRFSGNTYRDIICDYVYDGQGNITQINFGWYDGTNGVAKFYYSNEDNPLYTFQTPMFLFTYIGGLNQPGYIPSDIALYFSPKRMIKKDDSSGNTNLKIEIIGGYAEGYITIKENNFHANTISMSCR